MWLVKLSFDDKHQRLWAKGSTQSLTAYSLKRKSE